MCSNLQGIWKANLLQSVDGQLGHTIEPCDWQLSVLNYPEIARRVALIHGRETSKVDWIPVRANAKAQRGKASGSLQSQNCHTKQLSWKHDNTVFLHWCYLEFWIIIPATALAPKNLNHWVWAPKIEKQLSCFCKERLHSWPSAAFPLISGMSMEVEPNVHNTASIIMSFSTPHWHNSYL